MVNNDKDGQPEHGYTILLNKSLAQVDKWKLMFEQIILRY